MINKKTSKAKRWDLLEANVEIRFQSQLPPDTILGVIYGDLIKKYKGPENLPILQIPEKVRLIDPNLKFQPYYKFTNQDFSLELGPKILIIRNQPYIKASKYVKWKKFSEEIKSVYKMIQYSKIINKIERIGVRYINFFENLDIFKKIRIEVNSPELIVKNIFLVIDAEENNFKSKVRISNKSEININSKIKNGSIIDIDTYCENPDKSLDIPKEITKGHDITKKILLDRV